MSHLYHQRQDNRHLWDRPQEDGLENRTVLSLDCIPLHKIRLEWNLILLNSYNSPNSMSGKNIKRKIIHFRYAIFTQRRAVAFQKEHSNHRKTSKNFYPTRIPL